MTKQAVVALTVFVPDGSYVARFRIGSDPQVAAVTFAGGKSKHPSWLPCSSGEKSID
jgi:hypothetical protein